MGVLDEVTKMRGQGMQDAEITRGLQERGISPKAINDALNQSDIKSAVNEDFSQQDNEGNYAPSPSGQYSPQTQEYSPQSYSPQQSQYQTQEYPSQESYQPQNYGQDYGDQGYQGYDSGYDNSAGYSGYGTDTGTIIEVAEQVFAEKIQKMQKQVEELTEFKTMAESKLNLAVERLKRIESTIDKLQLAILDKVGSYGKNLDSIKKEMSMMQNSFGKMVNKIADKTTERKNTSSAKKVVGKK